MNGCVVFGEITYQKTRKIHWPWPFSEAKKSKVINSKFQKKSTAAQIHHVQWRTSQARIHEWWVVVSSSTSISLLWLLRIRSRYLSYFFTPLERVYSLEQGSDVSDGVYYLYRIEADLKEPKKHDKAFGFPAGEASRSVTNYFVRKMSKLTFES